MSKQVFIRSVIIFALLFIFVFSGTSQEFWMGSYSPGALSAASICYNTIPSSISSAAAVGGSGSFTYQWYKNEGSGYSLWAAAGSGLNPIVAMTTGADVYRKATDPSTGWTANTNPVTITVGVAINTSYTLNVTTTPICSGSSVVMSITGSQSGFTYQLRNDANNSVVTTKAGTGSMLSFNEITPASSTTYNVLAIENATSCSAELSSTKTIVVEYPITSNSIITTDADVCSGSGFSINGSAAQGTGITYQWQKSTNGTTFANISGQTNEDLNNQSVTVDTWYRRITYSSSAVCGTSNETTDPVKMSVIPAIANNKITTTDFTTCYNSVPATIYADAATGGSGSASYLWQVSTSGPDSGFGTAPSPNTAQNYVPSVAITQTTWYRRRVIKGCYDYSDAIQVSLYSLTELTAASISRIGNQVGKYTQTISSPVSTGGNGTRYYRFTLKRGTTTVTGPSGWQTGLNYNFNMTSGHTLGTYYVVVESYTSSCPDDIASANSASWIHAACGTTTGDGNFTYSYGGTCYMIAQNDEAGTYEWGCDGTITGINDIDEGEANTNALAVLGCNAIAAKVCYNSTRNSFTNWYMPTHNEHMDILEPREGIWGLNTGEVYYWSSREYQRYDQFPEYPSSHAWFANYVHPSQLMQVTEKNIKLAVRCMRNAYE